MARSGRRGPRGSATALRPLHTAPPVTTRSSTAASSRSPGSQWPTDYRYPDRTYTDRLDLNVGGIAFELHHAKGETDDHTWTWVPEHRDPVLRRPFHLGLAQLREPPEGPAFPERVGRRAPGDDRARPRGPAARSRLSCRSAQTAYSIALTDTAELLESLVDQTLELMNQGARLDEILHTVEAPRHLCERPYLAPVYDEPEFVVRNIWRLYGGWYDGDPSTLKPAPQAALAAELATLAGGAGALADRARALAEVAKATEGHIGTGSCTIRVPSRPTSGWPVTWRSWPCSPTPHDPGVRRVHSEVFSLMASSRPRPWPRASTAGPPPDRRLGHRASEAADNRRREAPCRALRSQLPCAAVRLASVDPVKPPADQSGAATEPTHRCAHWPQEAGPASSRIRRRRRSPARRSRRLRRYPTFWGYRGSTSQGHAEFLMYVLTFIAAIVVGGLVALLMLWALSPLPAPQRRDAASVPVPRPGRGPLHDRSRS